MYKVYHALILNENEQMYDIDHHIATLSWLFDASIHLMMHKINTESLAFEYDDIYRQLKGMNKRLKNDSKLENISIGSGNIWKLGPTPAQDTIRAAYATVFLCLRGSYHYDKAAKYSISNLFLSHFSEKTGTYFVGNDKLIIKGCKYAINLKFNEQPQGRFVRAIIRKFMDRWVITLFSSEKEAVKRRGRE